MQFSLTGKSEPIFPADEISPVIYFIIKIYPDGQLTPLINSLKCDPTQKNAGSIEIGAIGGAIHLNFFEGSLYSPVFAKKMHVCI